jgi:hypothetical protein
VAKGSWWWCYWTLLAAAHGPGVVVKRKGTCCCTRTRGVSTSTETLPYIAPVLASLIGQACAVHIKLAIRKTPIYRCDLAIAQRKSTASTNCTSSHPVCPSLPAIRTIKHTRRASCDPMAVVSPASRCAFPSILSCRIAHPYATGRSEPSAVELRQVSCLTATF